MTDPIISSFYEKMAHVNLEAYGILDSNNQIHTLGTDSKIIGRIFEMFAQPVLEEIASENRYLLCTPEFQTAYPDFVMMRARDGKDKIAIDIKSTYIRSEGSSIKFALGSYASYMRNNTTNIAHQYTDYTKHYVIGFVYKRNGKAQESKVYPYEDRTNIQFPYYDVKYFMQEKHKIAGDKPGSGNTENIGSITTKNLSDFTNGNGPFSELGQNIYNIYWKYYPQYRDDSWPYKSLPEFLNWLPSHIDIVDLLHDFDRDAVLESVRQYKAKHNI